jgi:hypothetical protein
MEIVHGQPVTANLADTLVSFLELSEFNLSTFCSNSYVLVSVSLTSFYLLPSLFSPATNITKHNPSIFSYAFQDVFVLLDHVLIYFWNPTRALPAYLSYSLFSIFLKILLFVKLLVLS